MSDHSDRYTRFKFDLARNPMHPALRHEGMLQAALGLQHSALACNGSRPLRAAAQPTRDTPGCYRTLLCSQSSISRATSRLFFSIMTMWPLPWMPLSCSRMYSVFTPAWLRYLAVQWS